MNSLYIAAGCLTVGFLLLYKMYRDEVKATAEYRQKEIKKEFDLFRNYMIKIDEEKETNNLLKQFSSIDEIRQANERLSEGIRKYQL